MPISPKALALFRRGGLILDEAMKAGIVATACSLLIITALFVAMLALPISIG
jgi:hypothetical protein